MRPGKFFPLIIALSFAIFASETTAQSTEFVYQGQLTNSTAPATGSFDFEFLLFDAASGGSQVGSTLTRSGVAVANGIFSTDLDFGANFPGANRFLEIRVRQAGGGAFTTLLPRQPMTSTPYAVRSLSANTATNATTASTAGTFTGNMAGDVTGTQVSTTVARLQGRNVAGTTPGNGQVLKFNSTNNRWEPGTDETASGGGGGGTITGVTAGTGLSGGGASGNVTLSIANNGVGTPQIADNAVSTVKLVDIAVTTPKLADNSVLSAKISDGAVTTAKIADSAVGTAKIADNSVTDAKIVAVSGAKVTGAVANATNAVNATTAATATTATTANSATTATSFTGPLAGDVTGNQGTTTVVRLQGRNVANTLPTNGQVLKFNTTTSQWEPAVDEAGSAGGGTITGVTAGTGLTGGGTSGSVALAIANNGINTAQIADGSVTATKISSAQVVKSVNGVQDNVTIAGGSNISVTPSGNTLTIASTTPSVNAILNQTTQQVGANFNLGGTGTAAFLNATTQFNIGGVRILGNSGINNLFVGTLTGPSNSGNRNSFVGISAGEANTTGGGNSFFGSEAGSDNTSGIQNSFFGNGTGSRNTTGGFNTFFGDSSGLLNSSGGTNSFFGKSSGSQNDGDHNVFIGGFTGGLNVGGNFNTAIGAQADFGFGFLENATAVGARARVSASNSLVLGSINGTGGATSSTNVGVGTTAPSQRLHVVGNGLFDGNLSVTGSISGTIPSGSASYIQNTATLQALSNFNISGNGLIGGNVGIGTTTPAHPLHISRTGNTELLIESTAAAGRAWGLQAGSTGRFQIIDRTQGAARITVLENGFVGIGNAAPEDRLNVNGNVSLILNSGGSTAVCQNSTNFRLTTCSSSFRYKNEITPFGFGLDLVQKLRPVSFTWKNDGKPDLGLVAEDVAAIEPLLVTYNGKGEVEGVKYDRIGVVLVNAVKEQQAQIESQRRQIDELKQIVCEIRPSAKACSPK